MITGKKMKKLKKFSDIIEEKGQILACSCGSRGFFDWGIEVCWSSEEYGPSPRAKDWTGSQTVKVCMNCHTPVVFFDGTLYSASDIISQQEIEALIRFGQSRKHVMPSLKVMDP